MSKRKRDNEEEKIDLVLEARKKEQKERQKIDEAYNRLVNEQLDEQMLLLRDNDEQDVGSNFSKSEMIGGQLGDSETINEYGSQYEQENNDILWTREEYEQFLREKKYDRLLFLYRILVDVFKDEVQEDMKSIEKAIEDNKLDELNYLSTLLSIKYDEYQENNFRDDLFEEQDMLDEARNFRQIDRRNIMRQNLRQQEEDDRELKRKIRQEEKELMEMKKRREEEDKRKISEAGEQMKREQRQEELDKLFLQKNRLYQSQKEQVRLHKRVIKKDKQIEKEKEEIKIPIKRENKPEKKQEMDKITYGYLNKQFKDTFNSDKNLLPRLPEMRKFSNREDENESATRIPNPNYIFPGVDYKYTEKMDELCDDVLKLDAIITQEYKRPNQTNDGSLIQVYIKRLAIVLFKYDFVREFLYKENETLRQILRDVVVNPLIKLQSDNQNQPIDDYQQQRDRYANQLRFIILGAPLYCEFFVNNVLVAQKKELFKEQIEFIELIEGQQQNNTLTYLHYFMDGYMKSNQFRLHNQIKQQEMRQMYLQPDNKPLEGQRQRVGFYQTNRNDRGMEGDYMESIDVNITDQFISRYIPLAKIINISDLLFLNGVKMPVYYKAIRLFHSMYMKLRKSAPFTNTFNFYSKIPFLNSYGKEEHQIITNPHPMMLISLILATLKEYLSLRVEEDLNYPANFVKELLYTVLPQQSTVSCQSIGCLYGLTISDVRLEPLIMIATLIGRVFGNNPANLFQTSTFKLGWSFFKGAYQYIPSFRYINTIIPFEWTTFYKQIFDTLLQKSYRLTAMEIQQIYDDVINDSHRNFIDQGKQKRQRRNLQNNDRSISLKSYIVRVQNGIEQFEISSLYLEKAFVFLEKKHENFTSNWSIYQASYLLAGIILDTFIIKIQESLNDQVSLLTKTEQDIINQDENISQASLQYFSIIQRKEQNDLNIVEVELVEFKSMEIMPYVLWLKHCHQTYKPYDLVALEYNISCILMLVWFSSTKQYNLGLGDCENDKLRIFNSFQLWQARNLETVEQCDNIFVNSTKLMTTLKKFLRQDNLRVVQIANVQYAVNVNQKKDEFLMLSKNDSKQYQFIVGIYYDHIFMINHFVPTLKKNNEKGYIPPTLTSRKNTRTTYKPIINAIVFDIETTQIKIDSSIEKQSHDMIPFMISSIQYQFTQNAMEIMDKQTLYKENDDNDFLGMMYKHWLNQITIWDTDFYIITFNGCKFDLQFIYKYFVQYHSGCIEIFGTLLSPKYIQISFNEHKIKFIDLYLILGDGSLNKWSEKCGLGQKLEFRPIYNIDEFLNLSLEEKKLIVDYCEQDVKLTGSIYYLQCLNMVQMLKDLNVKFNRENAIDVLKPTLASTAFSIFKNGFVDKSIKYINSIEWLAEQNVRQAYNGGFCHCYQLGEIKGEISYFDINSLYPFIMLQEFPEAPPRYEYVNLSLEDLPSFLDVEKYTHWKITDFQYKDNTKICLIPQRIHSMNFYFQSGYDLQDCYVPSYVLRLILNDLVFIRVRGALRYHCNFSYVFKDYVTQMYDLRLLAKQSKDELSEKRIKTLMNALYGKTAQSAKLKQDLVAREHRNAFETSGACSFEFSEYLNAFILDIPVSKDDSLSYLALEIASRARFYLFETIYKNKKGIIYCDTDSVILNQQPMDIRVDEIKLGYWKDVYKDKTVNGLYIYSPKVYEVRYLTMKDGLLQQKSEIKMKGVDKSNKNFSENFQKLQNTFEGSFEEQIVWNKQNGFVRQNKISKKLKHRLRRYVEEDGTTRPFMNIQEYETFFRKLLILKDNKFIYV